MRIEARIANVLVHIHYQKQGDALNYHKWVMTAIDEHDGIVTDSAAFLARRTGITQDLSGMRKLYPVLDTDEYRERILARLRKRGRILVWLEEVASMFVLSKTATVEPLRPEPSELSLPGLNTLDYAALVDAFENTVLQNNGVAERGIQAGYRISLEDGLPWFEIGMIGKPSEAKAKRMVQDFANAMNIRVLYNRIEGRTDDWQVVGCFDIDPEALRETPVPSYSRDEDAAEFMEDYGTPFLPAKSTAKT